MYLSKRTYKVKHNKKDLGYKKSKEWQEFYGSRAWQRLREWYITNHPLCENCQRYLLSEPATEVHHKKPFRLGKTKEEKWDLFLDVDNLESLCNSCHHKIHEEINKTGTIVYETIPAKLEYDHI